VCADFFTTVILELKGGELVERWITGLQLGRFGVTLLFLGAIFVLGMFMDWIGILLVFLPIAVPIITAVGIDPLWFAILFFITGCSAVYTVANNSTCDNIHIPRHSPTGCQELSSEFDRIAECLPNIVR